MKTFFKILLSFLLLNFGVALVRTAFSVQDQLFIERSYYDEMHSVTFFGGALIIILGSIFLVYALSFLAKSKKSKIILGSLISAIIILIYYISEKRKFDENFNDEIVEVQEVGEVDEITEEPATFTSVEEGVYAYQGKLIKFLSPFELDERSALDSLFMLKTNRSDNFALNFIEFDATIAKNKFQPDQVEAMEENFRNYFMPKKMIELTFREAFGVDIQPDEINVSRADETYCTLSCTKNGYIGSAIFQTKGQYQSVLISIWKDPHGQKYFEDLIESTEIIN
ncbi:hypothetical protein [Kaistella sp.]|uniref:hypothetical protein n=1 Tax=Kaistella sp. TaxID=2782235 RepID=UPI002F9468BC